MKTSLRQPFNRQSGMTLIELTVVILVLLTLIAVITIGATAWKRGSDRAACILNIRNVQQAVRGHQNMTEKTTTDPIPWVQIIGNTGYLQFPPVCPSGGTYQPIVNYPAPDTLAYPCNVPAALSHFPPNTSGW